MTRKKKSKSGLKQTSTEKKKKSKKMTTNDVETPQNIINPSLPPQSPPDPNREQP